MEQERENLIGVFTTDSDLRVQVWDAALERMTGILAKEALGRSIVDLVPDIEQRSILDRFRRSLTHGTIEVLAPAFHRYLIKCDPLFPTKQFKEMRQQVTIAPLKEQDTIKGLIVSIEDVTQRIEREIEAASLLKDADETVRLNAASTISDSEAGLDRSVAEPIIEGLGDPSWRVRRKLVEGMTRRAAPDAIEALLNALKERHLDFGVVNSALQILRASAVDTTETLVEFLNSDETDLRMHAALALGEQNENGVAPALIATLGDPDINVRYHAIEALGKIKAADATEPLLAIVNEQDFFLSFAALDALAEIGDATTGARILPLLENGLLREAALRTLAAVGSPNDIVPIIQLLNEDGSISGAVATAAAVLFRRFEKDPDAREKIVELARLKIDSRGLSNLAVALDAANEECLEQFLTLAGWFNDERLISKLIASLSQDELRDRAVLGLLTQGENALNLLFLQLESNDRQARSIAVRMLGEIGDARAIAHLVKMIESEDAGERREVAAALSRIDDPGSADLLAGMADHPDPETRAAAIRGLGRSAGHQNHTEIIIKASSDEDERVRQVALELLPNVMGETSTTALITALKTETPRVRATAVQSLAKIDSPLSIEALQQALNDDDPWTRYFAVRGIGIRGDRSSADALNSIIENDPAEHVRIAAREVMIELGI